MYQRGLLTHDEHSQCRHQVYLGCCRDFEGLRVAVISHGVTIERICKLLTKTLQMPLEPEEAHDNYHYVYEAQVGQDRNEVNVELLICLEILDVDTTKHVRNRHGDSAAKESKQRTCSSQTLWTHWHQRTKRRWRACFRKGTG